MEDFLSPWWVRAYPQPHPQMLELPEKCAMNIKYRFFYIVHSKVLKASIIFYLAEHLMVDYFKSRVGESLLPSKPPALLTNVRLA
jgi:hypothetical protein